MGSNRKRVKKCYCKACGSPRIMELKSGGCYCKDCKFVCRKCKGCGCNRS